LGIDLTLLCSLAGSSRSGENVVLEIRGHRLQGAGVVAVAVAVGVLVGVAVAVAVAVGVTVGVDVIELVQMSECPE
jgi:hypothetical protein